MPSPARSNYIFCHNEIKGFKKVCVHHISALSRPIAPFWCQNFRAQTAHIHPPTEPTIGACHQPSNSCSLTYTLCIQLKQPKTMGNLTEILTLAQERAQALDLPYKGALTPTEAYLVLTLAPDSKLVDVRTRAEWDWVGRIPEALEIEWNQYPDGVRNPHFLAELQRKADPESLLMFICRSGVRSDNAARAAKTAGYTGCYNVLEGFEGDKDANGHRNTCGGWRHAGLPWIQG